MSDAAFVSALVGVGVALLFGSLSAIGRRLNRLSRLEAKVDALLKGAGIAFDELHDVPADVRDALERGETILAIQRFRQATGAGLKEARSFIREVERRKADATARLRTAALARGASRPSSTTPQEP
jgi:hypothetical protein